MVIHATPTNAFAPNTVPQQYQEHLSRKFNLEFLSSLPRIAMRIRLNFSLRIKAVHHTPFTTAALSYLELHALNNAYLAWLRGTFSQQKLIDSFYDIEKRFTYQPRYP